MVMVVAIGFRAKVFGVAVGWWCGHGFQVRYVLRGGGGSRWLRCLDFCFYYVEILF